MNLPYYTADVTRISGRDAVYNRSKLASDKKKKIRRELIRRYDGRLTDRQKSLLELHHILPISYGGTHDIENFALVEHDLHSYVHFIISAQAVGLEVGATRNLKIPILSQTVWIGDYRKLVR